MAPMRTYNGTAILYIFYSSDEDFPELACERPGVRTRLLLWTKGLMNEYRLLWVRSRDKILVEWAVAILIRMERPSLIKEEGRYNLPSIWNNDLRRERQGQHLVPTTNLASKLLTQSRALCNVQNESTPK